MTTSRSASRSQDQPPAKASLSPAAVSTAGKPAGKPWWRRWSDPVVVATVVASLTAAFVMVAAAGFQSVKGDVRDSEARLHEEVRTSEARLTERIQTTEARLREEIQASEARVNKRIDGGKEEIQAVNRRLDAMNDKMDRLLETLLASQS